MKRERGWRVKGEGTGKKGTTYVSPSYSNTASQPVCLSDRKSESRFVISRLRLKKSKTGKRRSYEDNKKGVKRHREINIQRVKGMGLMNQKSSGGEKKGFQIYVGWNLYHTYRSASVLSRVRSCPGCHAYELATFLSRYRRLSSCLCLSLSI
jgi:hypothetical protein